MGSKRTPNLRQAREKRKVSPVVKTLRAVTERRSEKLSRVYPGALPVHTREVAGRTLALLREPHREAKYSASGPVVLLSDFYDEVRRRLGYTAGKKLRGVAFRKNISSEALERFLLTHLARRIAEIDMPANNARVRARMRPSFLREIRRKPELFIFRSVLGVPNPGDETKITARCAALGKAAAERLRLERATSWIIPRNISVFGGKR